MYRLLLDNLEIWRLSPRRKPLILKGARQAGKTYLLKTWGNAHFPKVHIVNFEQKSAIAKIFERDLDVKRIISELSFATESAIDPKTDLLIFDEIQACPRALTSLKYFCEDMPELALACAGSLLGVSLSSESFPVGKVSFLHLHPMSFPEFLMAVDTRETGKYLPKPSINATIPPLVHEHLWDLLRLYYVTGGMPEAVSILAQTTASARVKMRDILEEVRTVQRAILQSYEQDFAKHAGKINAVHIQALYQNIPSQLAAVQDESIRRFQFGDVLPNKKGFAAWERPIQWLKNAGLVQKIKIANKSALPLEHYTKPNLFKLLPNDIGLLGCMQNLAPAVLLDQSFGIAKGYFAEVYVAQALQAASAIDFDHLLYCWNEGESEIEYLYPRHLGLIPIEVKSGLRTKSRSLNQYLLKYNPGLAIRLSAKPFHYDPSKKLLDLPLPLAHWIPDLV
jgi:uncharacterized protein